MVPPAMRVNVRKAGLHQEALILFCWMVRCSSRLTLNFLLRLQLWKTISYLKQIESISWIVYSSYKRNSYVQGWIASYFYAYFAWFQFNYKSSNSRLHIHRHKQTLIVKLRQVSRRPLLSISLVSSFLFWMRLLVQRFFHVRAHATTKLFSFVGAENSMQCIFYSL